MTGSGIGQDIHFCHFW